MSTTNCECADPGCPVCAGKCKHHAKSVAFRIDMEDRTGTPMCERCANDAMDSGVFDIRPLRKGHKL